MRPTDFSRLREALEGPGIDTRVWTAEARIDDDPDAIEWDSELGWLADVTFVGGPLDGEGPVRCRVASPIQGAGDGIHIPPVRGSLVAVVIPGDINQDAVIVGALHSTGETAPSTVNGDTIVESDASAGQVAAEDTVIVAEPNRDIDVEARNVRVTGSSLVLGVAAADQSYVRGEDKADADESLASALNTLLQAMVTDLGAPGSAAAFTGTWAPALARFRTARNEYLSNRIKGD